MSDKLKIFLSHSSSDEDKGLIDGIAALAIARKDLEVWIAERDFKPGCIIIDKVNEALRECDCVWALLTHKGNDSSFVNNEIGAATILGMQIIPMLEEGEELKGIIGGSEYVRFDRTGQVVKILDILTFLEVNAKEIKRKGPRSSNDMVKALKLRIAELEKETTAIRKSREDPRFASSSLDTKDKQLFDLGFQFGSQGHYVAAEALFLGYLKKQPEDPGAYYNLGVIHGRQGMVDDAINAYKKAIQIKPDFAEAYYNIGTIQLKEGKIDAAFIALQEVIRIYPDDPGANILLLYINTEKAKQQESSEYQKRVLIKLEQKKQRSSKIT